MLKSFITILALLFCGNFILNVLTMSPTVIREKVDESIIDIDILPDVIVRETDSYHTYKLEAFKNKAKKYADSKQHKQLEWFSIGTPKLIKRVASKTASFFNFKPQGFYVFIEMLTRQQQ